MYIESDPVCPVDFIPIEVAIRKERTRILDIEFETGVRPSCAKLGYMYEQRSKGVTQWALVKF
jgi:hypothetical protein